MTSPTSKISSTVKPLEDWEREAWAATNVAEEKERYARFQSLSFLEKLRILEANGRFFAEWRERRVARRAGSDSKPGTK